MKRESFAAASVLVGLFAGTPPAHGDDLKTLSGEIYRHAVPIRVEPDGVTWRYELGIVKVDFADCPESIRTAYHYEPVVAEAYRQAQAAARQQAEEQAKHDAANHDAHRRELATAAAARTAVGTEEATIFRRALSPAASQTTRETAARMQAEADRRAAEDHDLLKPVPPLPSLLGPRPVNPFMDTPNAREYAADLHRSPTGATGNFVPTATDANRITVLDTPLYLTRSYYEDVDRAEAFARGVPLKQP